MGRIKKAAKVAKQPKVNLYDKVAEQFGDLIDYDPPPRDDGDTSLLTAKQLRQKLTIDIFIACLGNVEATCRIAKIGKSTFWVWMKESEFQQKLNQRKIEWELLLWNRTMQFALNGNTTLLIFLQKFLNPYFDDNFRTRMLSDMLGESLYDRYPIPNPELLPPEVPERFRTAIGSEPAQAEGENKDPAPLVHDGGDT